jgi:hypothetical protein
LIGCCRHGDPEKRQGEYLWGRRKRKKNVVKNIRRKRANDALIAPKPD